MRVEPHELDALRVRCTLKQWAAVALWNSGHGWRRIGVYLNIAPTTAKGRVVGGLKRSGMDYEEVITRNAKVG